jgi:hypothetical protein
VRDRNEARWDPDELIARLAGVEWTMELAGGSLFDDVRLAEARPA